MIEALFPDYARRVEYLDIEDGHLVGGVRAEPC
jgi:hypothetical protein